jgi:two-component system chemotaxis response regulator CheY
MGIRTLIVDDQEDIRLLMRVMIQTANDGLSVRGEAEGGEVALQIIDAVDPDVVVIDQMMPGMTGVETAARIRERRPDQKMIMCTAFLDETVRKEAHDAGFSLVIGKDRMADIPQAVRTVGQGAPAQN